LTETLETYQKAQDDLKSKLENVQKVLQMKNAALKETSAACQEKVSW
jgi:uncharacterized protein YukE